jgi:hypothetical protein
MQPQTMNAPTIAQKIQSCICCIVVFSGRLTPPSHYKAFRVSSVAQQPRQLHHVGRNPPCVLATRTNFSSPGKTARTEPSARLDPLQSSSEPDHPCSRSFFAALGLATQIGWPKSITTAPFCDKGAAHNLSVGPHSRSLIQVKIHSPTGAHQNSKAAGKMENPTALPSSPIRAVFSDGIPSGCRSWAVKPVRLALHLRPILPSCTKEVKLSLQQWKPSLLR